MANSKDPHSKELSRKYMLGRNFLLPAKFCKKHLHADAKLNLKFGDHSYAVEYKHEKNHLTDGWKLARTAEKLGVGDILHFTLQGTDLLVTVTKPLKEEVPGGAEKNNNNKSPVDLPEGEKDLPEGEEDKEAKAEEDKEEKAEDKDEEDKAEEDKEEKAEDKDEVEAEDNHDEKNPNPNPEVPGGHPDVKKIEIPVAERTDDEKEKAVEVDENVDASKKKKNEDVKDLLGENLEAVITAAVAAALVPVVAELSTLKGRTSLSSRRE